jgi:rifampicin phosphotransferase
MTPALLWLDDPLATDFSLTGPKAGRLAVLRQAGFPIPNGFVLTTEAFNGGLTADLIERAHEAYHDLTGRSDDPSPVAVRSSATAEDLAQASFAGLQETVLGVTGEDALVAAIHRVWESADSPRARAYQERAGLEWVSTAVLVQLQVEATVAGVAFGRDPLTGEEATVVEAVPGLGSALVSGEQEPQSWRLLRQRNKPLKVLLAPADPLLRREQLEALAGIVEQAGIVFGAPQDVEWACDASGLQVVQSRPITGRKEDWFTQHLPGDNFLWTAAFLNERFTEPVSPLGWTLVELPLERLALRGPLEMLEADLPDEPLLKLWRGHPYSRVAGWQRLYKLFPDGLLPEDAARYFPEGDVSLRHAPRRPTFGLHLLRNGLRVLRDEFQAASPLHNPHAWARYEQRQAAMLIRFRFLERQLARSTDPVLAARDLLQQVVELTDSLLALHRWSLLYADLTYSLMRRLLGLRHGAARGATRAVQLTTAVETRTSQMNRRLADLAVLAAQHPVLFQFLEDAARTGELDLAAERGKGLLGLYKQELTTFLAEHGHRFFSLDLYDPPWEADPPALARLLLTLAGGMNGSTNVDSSELVQSRPWARPFVRLTQEYLRLREAQRYHWQQLQALQRRVALRLGQWWVERGLLRAREDVFGLTWSELMEGEPDGEVAATRMRRLQRLRAQARQAPGWHYPDFLRGNVSLRPAAGERELLGRPVSPGIARGAARLIAHPGDFERIRPGDVLVTTSPDPGWTPIFDTVAGMVTERGGQLSHGAVVAREYRLPAVSGIPGIMGILQEGEPLLVDGTQGIVVRLAEPATQER